MKPRQVASKVVGSLTLVGALVSFLYVAGCGDSATSASGWHRISSVEGGFSLEFPKEPETKKVTGRMNDPRFQDAALFTLQQDGLVFLAAYGDEFGDTVAQYSTARILDAARDGALSNVQGQLLYELSITKNGFPGREIHLRVGGNTGRIRIYPVGRRKYVLGVFGRDGEIAASTERFLNSFEFARP